MSDKVTSYRSSPLKRRTPAGPASLDVSTRSVDVVATTEQPVPMWDWERGVLDEVLLMRGAVLPKNGQLPLLDSHSRGSVGDVVGSARDLRVEGGELVATAVFSKSERAEEAFLKVQEGHLTDVSIGYAVNDATVVPGGEKAVIGGRAWEGPVRVVTSWTPRELSVCPIGADDLAKFRAAAPAHNINVEVREEHSMELNRTEQKLDQVISALGTLTETLSRGLAPAPAAPAPAPAGVLSDEDAERIRANARHKVDSEADRIARAETERVKEIRAMGDNFGLPELADKWIDERVTLEEARAKILVAIRDRGSRAEAGLNIQFGKEDREKFRDVAEESVLVRAGLVTRAAAKHTDTGVASMSLFELAKETLRHSSQSAKGDKMEVFERALSSSDFPNILANVANKAVLMGFEEANETYPAWADTTGVLNDFRAHEFSRTSEAPSLEEINPDGGEYTYGKLTDAKESVTAVDYGVIVAFTRKAMVNDDLSQLTDTQRKLGLSASRKYGDLVYAVLTANAAMGDGTALFASGHGNLSAAAAAPTNALLGVVAAAMGVQKDKQSLQYLNVRPEYILSPWAHVDDVLGIVADITPATAATANIWRNLTPVFDARLDANSNGATAAWYVAGRKGMTVKLFTLNGNLVPFIESRAGWAVDGMEFKCRVSAAAKAMDWVGLYKYFSS